MRCSSLSVKGWQNLGNIKVKFRHAGYLCLKFSRIVSLLQIRQGGRSSGSSPSGPQHTLQILSSPDYSRAEVTADARLSG
jgi:hypothetical protein